MTITRTNSGPWSVGANDTSRRTSLASSDSGFISNGSSEASTPEHSPSSESLTKISTLGLSQIEPICFGPTGGLPFRAVLTMNGRTRLLSPWRDIQLFWPGGLLSCVCKSPAGTWLRYEVAVNEPLHPLRLTRAPSAFKAHTQKKLEMGYVLQRTASRGWQRVRSHLLQSQKPAHFIDNSPWNIGMLPQTWGNTGKLGDASRSTPDGTLGIVEIGQGRARKTGEVYPVKPLGAFSVHGESGETSWKVLGIDVQDPMAALLHDVGDIQSLLPGITEMIIEWLETHLGISSANKGRFVIKGPFQLAVAVGKIRDHHKAWQLSNSQVASHPPLPIQPGAEVHPQMLEKIWTELTAKDRRSLLGTVPASNPETLLLLDESWFGGEEEGGEGLLVDIIEPSEALASVPEGVPSILEAEEEPPLEKYSSREEPGQSLPAAEQFVCRTGGGSREQPARLAVGLAKLAANPALFGPAGRKEVSGMSAASHFVAVKGQQKGAVLASQNTKKSSILSFWFSGRKKKFGVA